MKQTSRLQPAVRLELRQSQKTALRGIQAYALADCGDGLHFALHGLAVAHSGLLRDRELGTGKTLQRRVGGEKLPHAAGERLLERAHRKILERGDPRTAQPGEVPHRSQTQGDVFTEYTDIRPLAAF